MCCMGNVPAYERVRKIIAQVTRIDAESITLCTRLIEDLMVDSLQGYEIKFLLEEEFRLKFDDIELYNVTTIEEILELIDEYCQKA